MNYKTPGVYVEEISVFPPSVAAVETAIPAFIGYTEKAIKDGEDLKLKPTRITSLKEFEDYFGKAKSQSVDVDIAVTEVDGDITAVNVALNGVLSNSDFVPDFLLYYSMQFFFSNGGGPCYIVSVNPYNDDPTGVKAADIKAGVEAVEEHDEPTMLVSPDAVNLSTTEVYKNNFSTPALQQCTKLMDRVTIIDFKDAHTKANGEVADITDFRNDGVPSDLENVKYGAAYFPYLKTGIPFSYPDNYSSVTVKGHTINGVAAAPADTLADKTLDEADFDTQDLIKNSIKDFVNGLMTILPPSGAMAGIYARVDNARGVWKAPANVSVAMANGPAFTITDDLNSVLNVDSVTGKSINAIREFTGKGTLVWGARTLAGNDNEWRYVPVRRFYNMVEESVKNASGRFVFEPNDANTWVKVRAMIENFLTTLWRQGALAGAKAEDAFFVRVGLGQTMSALDILEGRMIVEIGMAPVRPAEFIILKFSQKMQVS